MNPRPRPDSRRLHDCLSGGVVGLSSCLTKIMHATRNPAYQDFVLLRAVIAFAILCQAGSAGTTVWDGGGDGTSWSDPLNWVGDPNPVPSNDYDADFQFDATATPTTVSRPSANKIDDIFLKTAGWTINGNSFADGGGIQSLGAGTNTINPVWNQFDNNTWEVGPANTLVMASLYQRNKNINKTGEGMLNITTRIGGYSDGTWGIHIQQGIVRIAAAIPYSSTAGAIYISSPTARLQLLTTNQGAVQSLFGSRIIDEVGNGLQTTVNGAYVEVSSIQPPANLRVLAAEFDPLGDFKVTCSGLDPAKTYNLKRGPDLSTFPETVDTIAQPPADTAVFTDTDPRSDPPFEARAFYFVEEQQP